MIDFTPLRNKEVKVDAFAEAFTINDLRQATNDSIDYMLNLIADLDDTDVTFDPHDPNADDPYAVEGEENIGWSLAHLIAHVTASSEEGAAFSSLLARGVENVKERPRFETAWRDITTKAACVQRLEESRRMRLAYLETWPDEPNMKNYRVTSERFEEVFGKLNAVGAFLFGLSHEVGHYEQMEEVKKQAVARKETTA